MLLDIMRSAPGPVGVSMLARDAGMPKSTTFRLLAYLEQSGFVERAGKAYQLGWRLFELGNHVEHCRPSGLREIALPYLADLHARTGMNVHLAVLSGCDVVYLEKIHGLRSVPIATSVGTRMPATLSALGKAMLAYADRETLRHVVESGLEGADPVRVAARDISRQLTLARAC